MLAGKLPTSSCSWQMYPIDGNAVAITLYYQAGLAAATIAGSVTARGVIADFAAKDEAVANVILHQALQHLASRGTPRVHAIVHNEDRWRINRLSEIGFYVNEGEEAMLLSLSSRHDVIVNDLRVSKMKLEDIAQVHQLLSSKSELALCPWEDLAFFERIVESEKAAAYVTRSNGEITGALIGGCFHHSASICHLVVADNYRGQDLGIALCQQALSDFRRHGARRVHLLVMAENKGVVGFWRRLGFVSATEYLAMEIDYVF